VTAKEAEQMGMDKRPDYEEQMKVGRIDVLSKELNKAIQDEASQIADRDIEDYYHNNILKFEKVEMDRIYIPKTRQPPAASEEGLVEANGQERSQGSGQIMKEEAHNLHARAVAGEEFTKLQADAYRGRRNQECRSQHKHSDQAHVITAKPDFSNGFETRRGVVGTCRPQRLCYLQGQG
jgi:hypothetical protein